jgi:hypothetical protein
MRVSLVRSLLAVMVVGVFMGITAFMAIYPLVVKVQVDLNQYADFFAKTASVYTGIVGVIIGYYFGRATKDRGDISPAESPAPSPTAEP